MRALQLNVLGKELMASLWKRRDRDTGVTVRHVAAALTDAVALDRLLEPLPEARELRPRLASEFFARAWDARLQRDYWIASDGSSVVCFTIRGGLASGRRRRARRGMSSRRPQARSWRSPM